MTGSRRPAKKWIGNDSRSPGASPGATGVHDSGDASRAAVPGDTPGTLGSADAAAKIAQYSADFGRIDVVRAKARRVLPPTTYLVQDGTWHKLPPLFQADVFKGFHEAMKFDKTRHMQLLGVDARRVPRQINLTDAVVRLYLDNDAAKKGLIGNARRQIVQLRSQLGRGRGFWKVPSYYDTSTFDVGMSYTLKDRVARLTYPDGRAWICVTEGAVALREALGLWSGQKEVKPHSTRLPGDGAARVNWLKSLPADLQAWAGRAVGRVMAHEVMHQVWYDSWSGRHVYGSLINHPSTYLLDGDGAGTYWTERKNHGFSSTGRDWISKRLTKLAKLQLRGAAVPIVR
jgi:hypothetical protein